jgi:hypothetical protein
MRVYKHVLFTQTYQAMICANTAEAHVTQSAH